MKIIHVVLNLKIGGLEHLVCDMTKCQMDMGHEIILCSLEGKPDEYSGIDGHGCRTIYLGRRLGKDLRLLWRLYRVIKKERPDVVHTHNTVPLMYGAFLRYFLKVPVLINTRHGGMVLRRHRLFWKNYDSIVAISQATRKRLLQFNTVDASKVDVIYNGVDVTRFNNNFGSESKRNLYKELGIHKDNAVIGIIARLSKEKDHETLLKAFAQLKRKIGNAHLLIIGDGKERKKLEKVAQDLKMNENVSFVGFRKNIPQLLNIIDVFVLSSLFEGISLTLLEAMSASKPIVATAVGGNPEVVEDGKTGILVPVKDSNRMAEAMARILSDKQLAVKMGQEGRKRVETQFGLNRMVSEYMNVYEQARKTRQHG